MWYICRRYLAIRRLMWSLKALWDDDAVFRGRMGKLTLLLLALLRCQLQYSLWFGKNGIHDYSRVNVLVAQQATNAKRKRVTISFCRN